MALSKQQRELMTEILNIEEPPGMAEAIGLHLKLNALQARMLSDISDELGNIAAALERRPQL